METQKERWAKIWSGIRGTLVIILTSALFPAFVAFIGAIAGLWASIYANELKAAVAAMLASGVIRSNSPEVTIGASLFIAFFLLFALHQSAKNFQEAEARQDLLDETSRLKGLVERLETLPPDGFLQKFQTLYQEIAHLPLIPWSDDARKEDIEAAIRTILDAIANLANRFDGELDGEKYVANLMICRTQTQLAAISQHERLGLESRLVFCPDLPTPKLNGVAAVLEHVPSLCSDFDEQTGKSSTPDIVLPIPAQHDVDLGPQYGKRYTVLPGAPFCAATHRYSAFESIRALLSWCTEKGDLTLATTTEITAFFHNGRGAEIKSFISIPVCINVNRDAPALPGFGGLPLHTGGDSREDCLAVLNIHSKSENILGASGYGMFVPIIEPFIRNLALLLVSYSEALGPGQNGILAAKNGGTDDKEPHVP